MCEFCLEHGRGKKWFLNEDNYRLEMLEDKGRRKILEAYTGYSMDYYMRDSALSTKLVEKPIIGEIARYVINKITPHHYSGQVVKLEDALKIVDLSDDHVVLPCYCRKLIKGEEDLCCVNFGSIKRLELEANASKKLQEIDAYELKKRLKEWNDRGLVHQVIYAKVPYPISICNCERTYCVSMKARLNSRLNMGFMKGHDIAVVDYKKCDGCGGVVPKCVHRCQFGAIHFNPDKTQVTIDPQICFGCGICLKACENKAIELTDRWTGEY